MKKSTTKCLCLNEEAETLLATVSHDLKNPIISTIIAIESLNNPKFSPLNTFQKEILENTLSSLKYMKNLVINILDTYRIDHDLMVITKSPINFEGFVQQILAESQYIFNDKNQTINVTSDLKNQLIEIDSLEIKRVIKNLLINASIYSPENSDIKIKLSEKDNLVYFSIENKGFGIENAENIFNKFSKNNSCKKSISTGLGLFIVKEIITKHAGKIFVESQKNKYTRITFSLPRK